MLRGSPVRSRPMQKLAGGAAKFVRGGAQLFDSASAAVAQGTQLSNAVASRASEKAEEVVDRVRSPDKKKRASRGRGIRDRINKFDSASRGNVEYHNTAPSRSRTSHIRDPDGGGGEATTPPYNPYYCDKENDPNQDFCRSPIGSGRETRSPFRKKNRWESSEEWKSYSQNPNYRQDETETARGNETHDERGRTQGSREARNGRGERRRSAPRPSDEDADLAELNRAAVVGRTAKKEAANHSSAASSSFGVPRHKKRDSADHPLIASPLRKHIRGVHDSACSNAACTVLKEPFPLMRPRDVNPLAAVANWEVRDCSGSGGRSEGEMGHLGTLGSMTGNLKSAELGAKKGGRAFADDGCIGGDDGKRKDGEEALDLLTSAAFMFKHSRRNLG